MSHPSWVRGLKQLLDSDSYERYCVAPLVGAWIETANRTQLKIWRESHPSWVRGLKPVVMLLSVVVLLSHPSWVRGLKQETSIFVFRP